MRARRSPALPGCTTHINCANCLRYAGKWRREVVMPCLTSRTTTGIQLPLFTHTDHKDVA